MSAQPHSSQTSEFEPLTPKHGPRLRRGSWTLRTIQTLGLAAAVAAALSAYLLLSGLEPHAPLYAASAVGFGLFGISLPLLALSALLLIPTCALLCLPSLRQRFSVRGVWLALWWVNSALSLCMLSALIWGLVLVQASAGGYLLKPPSRPAHTPAASAR